MLLIEDRWEYAEQHTLDWDILNSPCGDCVYRQQDDCQYYNGNCPNENTE